MRLPVLGEGDGATLAVQQAPNGVVQTIFLEDKHRETGRGGGSRGSAGSPPNCPVEEGTDREPQESRHGSIS